MTPDDRLYANMPRPTASTYATERMFMSNERSMRMKPMPAKPSDSM